MPGWKWKAKQMSTFVKTEITVWNWAAQCCSCRWDYTTELLWSVTAPGKKMCGRTLPISSDVVWLLKPECPPYKRHNSKISEHFSSNNKSIIMRSFASLYCTFIEHSLKKAKRFLQLFAIWGACLGGHWDCLYILGFAGSSCVFAECFERYQEYYPASVVL